MRGEEVILLNFPISHFLKSLAHSAMHEYFDLCVLNVTEHKIRIGNTLWSGVGWLVIAMVMIPKKGKVLM